MWKTKDRLYKDDDWAALAVAPIVADASIGTDLSLKVFLQWHSSRCVLELNAAMRDGESG